MTFRVLDTNEDNKISLEEIFEVLEYLAKILLNDFEQEYQ